jgi:hypothetical protein
MLFVLGFDALGTNLDLLSIYLLRLNVYGEFSFGSDVGMASGISSGCSSSTAAAYSTHIFVRH